MEKPGVKRQKQSVNPHKQGKYLPGSRILVVDTEQFSLNPPDVLLILPWNIAEEIKIQNEKLIRRGMKILRAVPKLEYI